MFVSRVGQILPATCLSRTFELWSLEAKKTCITESDDELVLQKFSESIRFEDGRYLIAWLWKEVNMCLPDNHLLVLRRML